VSDLECLFGIADGAAHGAGASARCRVRPRCSLADTSLSNGSVFLGSTTGLLVVGARGRPLGGDRRSEYRDSGSASESGLAFS